MLISNSVNMMTKLNLKPTAGYLLIEPLGKEVKQLLEFICPIVQVKNLKKGKILELDQLKSPKKVQKGPHP